MERIPVDRTSPLHRVEVLGELLLAGADDPAAATVVPLSGACTLTCGDGEGVILDLRHDLGAGTELRLDVLGAVQADGVLAVSVTLETDPGSGPSGEGCEIEAWSTVLPSGSSRPFAVVLPGAEGWRAIARGTIALGPARP